MIEMYKAESVVEKKKFSWSKKRKEKKYKEFLH